jgi:hypothetical protein
MLLRVSGMLSMFQTRHRLASSLGPSQLHMVGAISFGSKQFDYATAPATSPAARCDGRHRAIGANHSTFDAAANCDGRLLMGGQQ